MNSSSGQAGIVNGVIAAKDSPFLQASQTGTSAATGFREALDTVATKDEKVNKKQIDRSPSLPSSVVGTNAEPTFSEESPLDTDDGSVMSLGGHEVKAETDQMLDSGLRNEMAPGNGLPTVDRQSLPVNVQSSGSEQESSTSSSANTRSAPAISTLTASGNGIVDKGETTSKADELAPKEATLRRDSSAKAMDAELSSTANESRRSPSSGGENRVALAALVNEHGVAGNSRHQPLADQSNSSAQLATTAQLATKTKTMAEGSQLFRTPLGINDLDPARMTRMSLDRAAVADGSGSERLTSFGLNRIETIRGQLERTRFSQSVSGEDARKGVESALRLAKVEALVSDLSSSVPRQVMAQGSSPSMLQPGHAAANLDPSLAATSSGSLTGQLAPKSLMPLTASASGIVNAKIDSAAWMEQIASHAKMAIKQDLRSVEIKLTPAHLGTIEILVAQDDESTQLAFFTKHAHVRDALESQLARLQKFFQEDGLELSDAWFSDQSLAEHRERQSSAEHGDEWSSSKLADGISAQETLSTTADQRQKSDPDRQLDVWA